jgi:hypothetical protein
MLAMNALSKASSQQDGYPAAYAVDDFSGTVWRPAADDAQPQLTIELSPATRFDVVQLFKVDGMRIMFGSGARRGFGGRGGALPVYKFKLETSMDGESFKTVLDCTKNDVARDTFYEDFAPERARFVRLTVTGWPEGQPLGVIDFTVFGRADGYEPASVATPTFTNLPLDSEYQRSR